MNHNHFIAVRPAQVEFARGAEDGVFIAWRADRRIARLQFDPARRRWELCAESELLPPAAREWFDPGAAGLQLQIPDWLRCEILSQLADWALHAAGEARQREAALLDRIVESTHALDEYRGDFVESNSPAHGRDDPAFAIPDDDDRCYAEALESCIAANRAALPPVSRAREGKEEEPTDG